MKIQGNQYVQGIVEVGRRVIEGFKSVFVDGNLDLLSTSEKYIRLTATEKATVTLPDATNIRGGFEFVFFTTTDFFTINNFDGVEVKHLEPGVIYYCYLMSSGTSAGEWVISVDTSYDIATGNSDTPDVGVRAYFKIEQEYTGSLK